MKLSHWKPMMLDLIDGVQVEVGIQSRRSTIFERES
jgi:hypothetical protein